MGIWNTLFGKPPKREKKEWYASTYTPLPKYVPVRQRDCDASLDGLVLNSTSKAAKLLDLSAAVGSDDYNVDIDQSVQHLDRVRKACQGAGMAYTVLDRYTGNDEFGAVETYIVQYGCERSIRPGFDGDEAVPNEIVEQWMPKRNRVPSLCNENCTGV